MAIFPFCSLKTLKFSHLWFFTQNALQGSYLCSPLKEHTLSPGALKTDKGCNEKYISDRQILL